MPLLSLKDKDRKHSIAEKLVVSRYDIDKELEKTGADSFRELVLRFYEGLRTRLIEHMKEKEENKDKEEVIDSIINSL